MKHGCDRIIEGLRAQCNVECQTVIWQNIRSLLINCSTFAHALQSIIRIEHDDFCSVSWVNSDSGFNNNGAL